MAESGAMTVTVQTENIPRVAAVVKAAAAPHAVLGPDEDPEWSALGAALADLAPRPTWGDGHYGKPNPKES